MSFIRSNYSDHFGTSALPVLEEIFNTRLKMHPQRRDALYKKVSHDRDIWQSSEVHDMDLFQTVGEGQEYTFRRPKQGANKTFTVTKFGLGFKITEEMIEDGKFGWVSDATAKLADSAMETKEIAGMNVFNNGFSTETTADGVALFSASHTLPSGLTFRNKPSSDADLSPTSLRTALSDFDQVFVGDSGIVKLMIPRYLLTHSNDKLYAKELLGSVGLPDSADNNLNPFKEEGLTPLSSPHLTDTDAWFLAAAPGESGLRLIERMPLQTKAGGMDIGFKEDAMYYKARYREVLGAIHAYGLYGNQGA